MDQPKNTELVPFGKYQGKPMAYLASDPGYCDWLMLQAWFKKAYPAVAEFISSGIVDVISSQSESTNLDTPVHNRMQARFLDDEFAFAVYSAVNTSIEERTINTRFEVGGWDVVLHGAGWHTVSIELKPTLGDDYPAVLRAMKRRGVTSGMVLVLGSFHTESIGFCDLHKIFASSGISVLLESTVESLVRINRREGVKQ